MLDIRLIREKADFVRARLATRGSGDESKIDEVLRVDAERRKLETALQQLNADRKRLKMSKRIWFFKSRTCRMRAFQLAKTQAQIESSAVGVKNRDLPSRLITLRSAPD